MKKIFKSKWFILFPFSLVAVVLIGVYYILASVYMLFDYLFLELDAIVNGKVDQVTEKLLIVRNLLTFFVVFAFYLIRCVIGIVLAIIYFLTDMFAIVGSIFTFRTNPFEFHSFLE